MLHWSTIELIYLVCACEKKDDCLFVEVHPLKFQFTICWLQICYMVVLMDCWYRISLLYICFFIDVKAQSLFHFISNERFSSGLWLGISEDSFTQVATNKIAVRLFFLNVDPRSSSICMIPLHVSRLVELYPIYDLSRGTISSSSLVSNPLYQKLSKLMEQQVW